jgi:formylmethanofuran dehydrogenase subunit E
MTGEEILSSNDFKKCVEFHGHTCPGLAIGYKAAKTAMDWLAENRAEDEELVAIVETDACSADAVQVLTGCTFGKGNFLYNDYGKQVFTLLSRKTGDGVRVALKPGVLEITQRHRELVQKIRKDVATEDERKEFSKLHLQKSQEVLEGSEDYLFVIKAVHVDLPPKATIEPSKPCEACGEPTMQSKLTDLGHRYLCPECLQRRGKSKGEGTK